MRLKQLSDPKVQCIHFCTLTSKQAVLNYMVGGSGDEPGVTKDTVQVLKEAGLIAR